MELLPDEVKHLLPPLRGQKHEADPICYVKFFHPLSWWTWYAMEYSTQEELFFGWVYGDFPELGYFSLEELEAVTVGGLGMERDIHFEPMRLSEVKKLHPPR
jgi:Protein of unknown function (DUF2958)